MRHTAARYTPVVREEDREAFNEFSENYRSMWTFMPQYPASVQVIARDVPHEEAQQEEAVVFHTFAEGLRGVLINVA
jgi:hypothetical protein